MSSNRRVSYIIPAPTSVVPKLCLPPLDTSRNGQVGPILLHTKGHKASNQNPVKKSTNVPAHPRHRLPVAALSLDAFTQLPGRTTPEGILYTGGRDGMIIGWDLGVPMKRKPVDGASPMRSSRLRWERLTGWTDDSSDEEDDDDCTTSDGDVLGYSKTNIRSRSSSKVEFNARESDWHINLDAFESGRPSSYLTSTQAHSDWVNDILLCNSGQTVISGSSDGSIKAWNPHSTISSYPTTIGTHTDYVRCLARSRAHDWLASGSFDRTIKLWDLTQTRKTPRMTLFPPESPGPKSSIYALATDSSGQIIASGGPERVVRTWDPKTGKRIGKLVGHTDNIRSILISDDAKYLLTGSADASIKLWSLASPQRCLHTFTHHTESVWSLFSAHPTLQIFYSGDRSGLVCRVDVDDGRDNDAGDFSVRAGSGPWRVDRVADGECVLLCRDDGESELGIPTSEGVTRIVALDDNLVWTASGSSSVKRWHVPPTRTARMKKGANAWSRDTTQLASNNHTPGDRRDQDVLYTNSSPSSPLTHTRSLSPPHHETPLSKRTARHSTAPSITASFVSNNSSFVHEHEGETGETDTHLGIHYDNLIRLSSPDDQFPHFTGVSRSNSRDADVATLYSAASVLSVPRQTRIPSAPTFPTHTRTLSPDSLVPPVLEIPTSRLHVSRDAYEQRDVAGDAIPLLNSPDEIIAGAKGLVRVTVLNDRIHALTVDTVGEVAVWDIVRCICLGVYTQEEVNNAIASSKKRGGSVSGDSTPGAEVAERRSPRQALETVRERIEGEAVVLAWATADTKIGELTVQLLDRWYESEIFADEAGYGSEWSFNDEHRLNVGKWLLRNLFSGFIREQLRIAARESEKLSALKAAAVHSRVEDVSNTQENAPHRAQTQASATSAKSNTPGSVPLGATASSSTTATSTPTGFQEYFSLKRRPSVTVQDTSDDFSGWAGPGSKSHNQDGVGLMGKLRNFGMGKSISRKATTDTEASSAAPSSTLVDSESTEVVAEPIPEPPKTLVEQLRSQNLSPPSANEAPPLHIPSSVTIVISEESQPGWTPVYRGTVASAGSDLGVLELERAMPDWLLELLLRNKSPSFSPTKIGFVLLPVPAAPGEVQLPELLNTAQSKLSASRFLRVRKLCGHVQDKLDKNTQASKPGTPTFTSSTSSPTPARPSTSASTSAQSTTPPSTPHRPATSPGTPNSSPGTTGHIPYPPGIPHPPAQELPRAEDVYEILCNEQVLPLDMTLAAVRQFIWRQAAELVMYYRRKQSTHNGK